MPNSIKLVECPRDAMQGMHEFIPTEQKAKYLNALLKVGFDTLDFGSFVSPKAIPQMRDTADVLKKLDLSETTTKLLAIVANERGAKDALQFDEIAYLGFPFSISETFQQRNTHSSIDESLITVEKMHELCMQNKKALVVYLSMGFGNPYGDAWSPEIVLSWAHKFAKMGINIVSIADTTGMATPQTIRDILPKLITELPATTIGVHLHSTPSTRIEKISAAWESGCRRFDSAMMGFGGCPFAADDLTGNIATEDLVRYLNQQGENLTINAAAWSESLLLANEIFINA